MFEALSVPIKLGEIRDQVWLGGEVNWNPFAGGLDNGTRFGYQLGATWPTARQEERWTGGGPRGGAHPYYEWVLGQDWRHYSSASLSASLGIVR